MGEDTNELEVPKILPEEAVKVLNQLNEEELRAAIDYAQKRKSIVHPTITEQLEPVLDNRETLRIEERPGYVEVVLKGKGSESSPELYHVQEEKRPEGGTHLHWRYLGQIQE